MKYSYCTLIYEGWELPLALEHISKAGFNGIELYKKDWRWAVETLTLDGFKKLLNEHKLGVSALAGEILTSEKDLDLIYEAADMAKELGCKNIFFLSASNSGDTNDGEFIKLCRKACEYLDRLSLIGVLHNHAGTIVDTVDRSIEFFKQIEYENFGLCFDSVHYALFENNMKDCVYKIAPYIKYVHLKDIHKTRDQIIETFPESQWKWGQLDTIAKEYTGLGEGVLDNRGIAEAILESGYNGDWWMVEIERQEYDRAEHAVNNFQRLKSYLKSI